MTRTNAQPAAPAETPAAAESVLPEGEFTFAEVDVPKVSRPNRFTEPMKRLDATYDETEKRSRRALSVALPADAVKAALLQMTRAANDLPTPRTVKHSYADGVLKFWLREKITRKQATPAATEAPASE